MRLKDKKKSTIINDRVKFLNVDKFYISKYVLYFNWFGYFNKDDTDWVIIGTTMRILCFKSIHLKEEVKMTWLNISLGLIMITKYSFLCIRFA